MHKVFQGERAIEKVCVCVCERERDRDRDRERQRGNSNQVIRFALY